MVAQGAISVNLKRGRGPFASLESLLGRSPSGAGTLVKFRASSLIMLKFTFVSLGKRPAAIYNFIVSR